MLDKFMYPKGSERQKIMERYSPRSDGLAAVYARNHQSDNDKKQRREIANKNERRRMQSINAGYEALKALIPHHDGEKLSKATILQQTGEYIQSLREEKTKLMAQNAQYKRILENEREREKEHLFNDSPPPKRRKRDTESSDEGISMGSSPDSSNEDGIEELQRALMDLRSQLNNERWLRTVLEKRIRSTIYTEKFSGLSNAYVQTDFVRRDEYDEVKSEDGSVKDEYQTYHTTSMSRKNLETMLEAIHHVEGHPRFDDRQYEDRVPTATIQIRTSSHPHHSDESEKDSSDQDDTKSESSDQCPTIQYTHRIHRHRLQNKYNQDNANKLVPQVTVHSEKYARLQTLPNQYYTPTSVIVHNS